MKTREPKPAKELEAELRRASILFADIQGSTELIQHLDPEAVIDILDPAVRAMMEEVERFEGVVSDRRGDGVLAVFGAPSAVEDHAVRACLAGLAIQDRISLQTPQKLKVRVGIHSGEVVLRHGRMGQFRVQDVFGAAVHIAARLEQTADPGSVCLSSTAYELAKGFVHAAPLPPIHMKGITDPIDRMLLLDADQTANRFAVRAEKGLADFINRIEECRILAQALQETGSPGLRLIQIFGPAGIGKSRIIHEFLSFDRVRNCYVVRFAGDHHRRYSAYHPTGNWLRALLDIRSSDSASSAERKLNRMLDQLGIATEEPRQELKAMLGIGSETVKRRDFFPEEVKPVQLGGTFAEIILRISAQKPIILACEDLDYFDPASYELVNSLGEALNRHSNVLVVATSRTRLHKRLLKTPSSRSLTLTPLSEHDATHLLTSLHSDFGKHPTLTETILKKAGGNPLFLEEVASLMLGTTKPSKSNERTADPFVAHASSNIPDHVEALIADRLVRLPKERRRLLQACAVVGVDVPLRLVAKLMEIPESELFKRFEKLQSEQLLFETRKYPDPQFTFKHSLVREVAYSGLLPSVRRNYHLKLVAILESEASQAHDRRIDDLCLHTIHAQEWSKAVKYLQMAAELAVDRGSYEFAETYLNRALEISRTLSEEEETLRARIEVLLALRSLAGANGRYLEANELLTEAGKIAHRLGDAEAQSRIMVHRAHILNTLGDLDLAVDLCERSRESARKLGDNQLLALATFFLGQAHFNLANFSAAEAAFGENEQVFLTQDLPASVGGLGTIPVLTYVTRAAARAFEGRFGAAFQDVTAAKNWATTTNRPYDLSFAWFGDGFVSLQQNDPGAALAALQESLKLAGARAAEQHSLAPAPDLGVSGEAAQRENSAVQRIQTGMGHALLMKGDTSDAIARLARAHDICSRHHRYMIQIWAATGLAFGHYIEGTYEPALRYANEAVAMARRFSFNCFFIQALRIRGLLQCERSVSKQAGFEDLGEALSAAQELTMRGAAGHCHASFVLAEGYDASRHKDEASRIFKELDMLPWWNHALELNALGKRVYC